MRITGAEPTLLFTGTRSRPLQIVRAWIGGLPGPVTVRVAGPGVSTPVPARVTGPGEAVAEIGIQVAAPHRPGSVLPVTVIAEHEAGRAEHEATVTVAEPGWTVWLVSHFHYDPVWWNTQGQFTQARLLLPDSSGVLPEVRTAFELVRLHLDAARDDPDYKFVLAEIDYLKPYLDAHPEDRAELAELIASGRVEIVGGAYNEPNTNLTSAESTIRNIACGVGFQRDVLAADPTLAWALDAFGHDPSYPGLMAAAGMTGSAWARGPFHQWGPLRTVGDNRRMQFASEFEWVSPDGEGLLTSYLPNHYGAGWGLHQAADLAGAEAEALAQLATLAPVAATRNVLLPVGADHVIPARWATAVHRDMAARYLWPRCVTALPREFFAAVRDEAAERGIWLAPQTRDMNPVYPGKDVSYIDTKQAQREAETAVEDGERLATLAALAGMPYPDESLDKAWRQLVFGAHHDAITGTESDQVYLDLLGGWREAFERGDAARRQAAGYLAGLASTVPPDGAPGRAVVVFSTLSWPHAGLATVTLAFGEPGTPWLALTDGTASVPFLAEGVLRHPDGTLAEVTITFRAHLPALGYRTYWVRPAPPAEAGWATVDGAAIENEAFVIEAGPGGTLARVRDRRTGAGLLRGPGNELLLQDEYDYHPRWGEGPWLLSPKGPGTGSAGVPATVTAQRCPIGSRLVAGFRLGGLAVRQETLLWDGADRVEFRTHVDGSIGSDKLLRVRFPASVPGGLPVYQCAAAVIGRPFGSVDTDVAQHPFTLDNPAHEWFGLGATARVRAGGQEFAIGAAEVILPADADRDAIRALVAALAAAGVTATCSQPGGSRYGAIDADSNLPDCRIAVGGPEDNPWTARLLAGLGAEADSKLPLWLPAARSRAEAFGPGADMRGDRDLPVLVVPLTAICPVTAGLAGAVIEAEAAFGGGEPWAGHCVALLNRGTPSSLVTPDGTLHIALMRACSAWPCGVWIDGERRTVPDGSSFAWQHWSHTFGYALAAGAGDWRSAGFALAGQEYNHPPLAIGTTQHPGTLPPTASLCEVSTPPGRPTAFLSALKPRGNPLAASQVVHPPGVTVRLRDGGCRAGTVAHLRLFPGVTAAGLTGPLEEGEGTPLAVTGGEVLAQARPAGIVTLSLTVAGGNGPVTPAPGGPSAAGPDTPGAEPAQPVFTRYWLHGKGPAPAGNLPVTVHLSPGRLTAPAAGERAGLRLTVACGPRPASGEVTLDVPDGLLVDVPGPLRYQLPARGYASWDLPVAAAEGLAGGRHFLAARIRDGLGQVFEDAVLVTAGEPPPPALGQPLDSLLPLLAADESATAAELDVSLGPGSLTLAPGQRGELAVRITSHTASPVRGECQLISPVGTWPLAQPWTTGFEVAPGGTATLSFGVTVPAAHTPAAAWALAKVMYFGRVRYSEAVSLAVSG
jgi:alpha-mannosidase